VEVEARAQELAQAGGGAECEVEVEAEAEAGVDADPGAVRRRLATAGGSGWRTHVASAGARAADHCRRAAAHRGFAAYFTAL
jgi:hypothetical protein